MASYAIKTNVLTDTTAGYALAPVTPDFTQFKSLSNKTGETVIGSVKSPLGFPNTFKFGARTIQNIYSGTGIDPGLYPAVKSGVSVVFQTNETWSMEAADDAAAPVFAVPVESHVVIRIPNNTLITTSLLVGLINRTLGSVLNSDLSNLSALIRGGTNFLPY